jgi:glucosamine--fructose-6-phosphate aminotransferase (isomerizing)
MCGIIGYIGPKARNIVIDGLYKLEYRGYDSAGIAEYNPNTKSYEIFKETGRVKDLKKTIKDNYETT